MTVNAGAVIADSIERFSPDAWKDAGAKDVYAFVRDEVRRRASEYLNQREQGLSVGAALDEVAATPSTEPIGLSFGEGDDEEQTEEEKAAAAKKLEEAKAKAMAKLAKKEANQRSLCNLEIKPWEADQDLKALYAKIKKTVVKDGLKWSEGLKLVDVAFGVQKIICTAVVNQTLSMDAIIEEITEDLFADEVQSMSMTSMSLL